MAVNKRAVAVVSVIAVGVLAFASLSLYNYLKGQEERVQKAMRENVALKKVVIAQGDISIGSAISSSDVKLVEWPTASVPEGAFAKTDDLVGRVPLQSIASGDPITGMKLLPKEGQPGILTYKIPEGHRAMTVAVDQVSGVAGFIMPESMVDVVMTADIKGRRDPISRIVLQNIPVLATGQVIEQKDGKPVIVPTVTLDVMPEDAEKLALATTQGKLQLLLRRSGDVDISSTKGATILSVISGVGTTPRPRAKVASVVKRPVRAASVVRRGPTTVNYVVEVWRENKKTSESFKIKKEG